MTLLAAGTISHGAEFPVWTFITDNYVGILTSNILISYFLATYCYVASFSVKHPKDPNMRELAAGGRTGNMLYDWFIGRELNPRINLPIFGEVDIKAWCELRPGMLGWIILDLAFIMQQYRNFGRVTDSIIIVTVAHTVYTFDALYMEPAILTTIDLIADGFGMMLSFGDLVWVPFTYSIQTRYLSIYPVDLGPMGVVGVLAVQGIGYYIFRSVNNEKNRFRTNPEDSRVKHLKYIETAAGSRLLVSGWWGMARHINYLGDWGKQYGVLAIGFDYFGSEEELVKNPIGHLYDIYVKVSNIQKDEADKVKALKADIATLKEEGKDTSAQETEITKIETEGIDEKARQYFKGMVDGEPKAIGIWKRFRVGAPSRRVDCARI